MEQYPTDDMTHALEERGWVRMMDGLYFKSPYWPRNSYSARMAVIIERLPEAEPELTDNLISKGEEHGQEKAQKERGVV